MSKYVLTDIQREVSTVLVKLFFSYDVSNKYTDFDDFRAKIVDADNFEIWEEIFAVIDNYIEFDNINNTVEFLSCLNNLHTLISNEIEQDLHELKYGDCPRELVYDTLKKYRAGYSKELYTSIKIDLDTAGLLEELI